MTPQEIEAVVILAAHATGQGEIVKQPAVDAWVSKVTSGTPLNEVVAEIVNTPEALAWKSSVGRLVEVNRQNVAALRVALGLPPA
jgi:hypothetical protein